MTENFFIAVFSNAVIAGLLAGIVALVSFRLRRASILHILWIVVLVRLVAPSVFPIHLLPSAGQPKVGVQMALAGPARTLQATTDSQPILNPERAAVAAWLAGILVLGTMATVRIRRMSRIVDDAAPAPTSVIKMSEVVADRFGIKPPQVVLSSEQMPPALWAIGGKPRIVLPRALVDNLSDDKVESLLAHETAHLMRRDHWVRWLEMTITIICWWNPLAWLASRQLRRVEERSCDERVVATFPEKRRAYAESLITTLRFLSTATTTRVPAAAGMADLSEVQWRLTEIMNPKNTNNPPKTVVRWLLVAAVVATLAASPLLMARPGDKAELPEVFSDHITLELDGASLNDVMQTFSRLTDTPFLVTGNTDATVTVSINDKSVYESLQLLAKTNDLQWSVHEGTVHVHAPLEDAKPMLVGTHDGQDVFRFIEGVFEDPKKLGGPNPKYPEESRKAGSQGIVLLDVLIDATGLVRDPIVKKSPDNLLSQASLHAVELWTFQPAMLDGQPVAVRYNLTIRFNLQ